MFSGISFFNRPMQDVIRAPSFVSKILKIPVFRLALGTDLVSRIFIFSHNFFSRIFKKNSRSFHDFNTTIAQKSLDRFIALGAKVEFVTPRDQKGRIQMMTFCAKDLEQKIQDLGGSWERRVVNNREVLAIIPPQKSSQAWVDFKEKLNHFNWKEENGMLITCDCSDVIPVDAPKKCFLYAHSTSSSFISDWKRANFYIGMKQDLCFFDNGNTWKNQGRPPSEESFYLEIEAAYAKIANNYAAENLWVGGSCGGAPIAAYLKSRLHNQGVNFFAEQSFPDLNDFVKPISPFWAPFVKGSLGSNDLPKHMQDKPPSCQFGAAKLWENLPLYTKQSGGKIIIVQVEKDEHIDESAYARYVALAKKVNTNVSHILYKSDAKWRHADNFFHYQGPRRSFIQALFN